jgi:hypothetical protein
MNSNSHKGGDRFRDEAAEDTGITSVSSARVVGSLGKISAGLPPSCRCRLITRRCSWFRIID